MSCGTRVQHIGPGDPDGARLLRSSLSDQLLAKRGTAYCWYCLYCSTTNCWCCWYFLPLYCVLLKRPVTAPPSLSDSQPRRPSCVCSGLEPHCRTSRCARPQPTPSPRYRSLTSLLILLRRPLITAGHPVRSPVPSPSCNNPGFETPPPNRPAHCNYVLLPGSSCLPGPAVLLATRETITTPPPNVYSSHHRFPGVPQRR